MTTRELQGREAAAKHIELLAGLPDHAMHFRLIHDADKNAPAQKRYGNLYGLKPEIDAASAEGRGIFLVVNEGGNTDAEITDIRAAFVDADNVALAGTTWHVPPDFIVQRDEKHWHAYWRVLDLSVAQFRDVQRRLAAHYGTDASVCNPSRVMRLAGTLHQKDRTRGVPLKLIDLTGGVESWALGHTVEELLCGLTGISKPAAAQQPSASAGEPIPLEVLKDALGYLDPNCPRADWIKYIAAIRAAPVPHDPDEKERRALAQQFSSGKLDRLHRCDSVTPERYTGPEAVDEAFDTMPPKQGGVGVGTIISAARAAGYAGHVRAKSVQETFAHCTSIGENGDAQPTGVSAKSSKFRVIFPRDMHNLPEPQYLVHSIIPDCAVSLIYGPPGSCKSFLVMDLLASIASGQPALGKFPTLQGDAVLCAGEAPYAIARKRWPAWALVRGIADPDSVRFAIVPAVPLVSDPAEIATLIEAIEAASVTPRIVALDTVARAIAGQDENDMRSAGHVTAAAERIRDRFNCAVVLVHHSGKDEDKGARGSSAFEGNADAVFKMSRDRERGVVSLKCTKMKDADETDAAYFKEQRVGESLVLNWIPKDEHASLTRKNGGPTRSDVGTALRRLGIDVPTRPLAVELVEADAGEHAINAMVRLLQRDAKGSFAAYVVHQGTGGRDGTMWGLRPAPSG